MIGEVKKQLTIANLSNPIKMDINIKCRPKIFEFLISKSNNFTKNIK